MTEDAHDRREVADPPWSSALADLLCVVPPALALLFVFTGGDWPLELLEVGGILAVVGAVSCAAIGFTKSRKVGSAFGAALALAGGAIAVAELVGALVLLTALGGVG